jgi:hypothetical protein
MTKQKVPKHKIPKNFLLEWTTQALARKQDGMLVLFDPAQKLYFPHYKLPDYGLWDTAVLLERQGYEIVEFHIFKEKETLNKNNQ